MSLSVLVVPEQRQQDDDGNGDAQQPKKHASTKAHVDLRLPHCEIQESNSLARITVPRPNNISATLGTSRKHLLLALRECREEISCAVSGHRLSDTKGTLDAESSLQAKGWSLDTDVSGTSQSKGSSDREAVGMTRSEESPDTKKPEARDKVVVR